MLLLKVFHGQSNSGREEVRTGDRSSGDSNLLHTHDIVRHDMDEGQADVEGCRRQDRALQPHCQDHDDIRGRLSVPVVDPDSVRGLGTVRYGAQISGGCFRMSDQSGRSLRLRGIYGHPSPVPDSRLSSSEIMHGSRILDLGSRISDLGSRISSTPRLFRSRIDSSI